MNILRTKGRNFKILFVIIFMLILVYLIVGLKVFDKENLLEFFLYRVGKVRVLVYFIL